SSLSSTISVAFSRSDDRRASDCLTSGRARPIFHQSIDGRARWMTELCGWRNIQQSRFLQPNRKRFTVRRIVGSGDLWVTEFVLSYDGRPSYTVSIMEFRDGQVGRETQYFADPFDPAPSRAHLVERAA